MAPREHNKRHIMTVVEPLHAPRKVSRPTSGTNLWTCPMHPQVQRSGPGSCPMCGMALEPMTPFGGDTANPELRDMTRRFWVCAGLSVPLVAVAMAGDFANLPLLGPRAIILAEFLL